MRVQIAGSMAALLLVITGVAYSAAEPQTLDVWPGRAPGDPQNAAPEQWNGKRVTNVTHPTLQIYRPEKNKDTEVGVVVCPGGGYRALMMSYEGEDVARWLNSIGITGIVLKYRVPAPANVAKYIPALQDAQRSLSLVRSKAKEWNLDPDRIGILGFSAGGHLAAATSTNFDTRSYAALDDMDKISSRPDFAVVIYPGGVVAKGSSQLSPEIHVTDKTPPMFIVQADNDPVDPRNAAYLYLALHEAKVPAELHIYSQGGHGFGLGKPGSSSAAWPAACEAWMKAQGILTPGPESPAATAGRPTRRAEEKSPAR